jgi:hypothetical protein
MDKLRQLEAERREWRQKSHEAKTATIQRKCQAHIDELDELIKREQSRLEESSREDMNQAAFRIVKEATKD